MVISYETLLRDLFALRPQKEKNISPISIAPLLELLGGPHLAYPTIHIAGTNGKGSVAVKISAALQAAHLKTGLYVSPHLLNYEERISINGTLIPKEKIIEYYTKLQSMNFPLKEKFNFFDYTTVFAFQYFQEEKVDVAVIETGVGGAFDATNVVKPLLSIITSVHFDHMEYLGTTLEEIAEQKGGIIKPFTPVVVGPSAYLAPILERAQAMQAPLSLVEKVFGFYDGQNQAIAKTALEVLTSKFALSSEVIQKGLQKRPAARFEQRGRVLLDVAHNPEGFAALREALEKKYPGQKFRFVVGMCKDKDHSAALKEIAPKVSHIHFVQAAYFRSVSPNVLGHAWQELSSTPYFLEKSVHEGINKAKTEAQKELIVICGSFYVIADFLEKNQDCDGGIDSLDCKLNVKHF